MNAQWEVRVKHGDRAKAQIRSKRGKHIGFWKVLGQKTKRMACDNVERCHFGAVASHCQSGTVWTVSALLLRVMLTCSFLVGRKRPWVTWDRMKAADRRKR